MTYIYPGRPPFSSSALYDSLPPSSISNISSAFSGVRKRESGRKEGRRRDRGRGSILPSHCYSVPWSKRSLKREEERGEETLCFVRRDCGNWRVRREEAFQLACLTDSPSVIPSPLCPHDKGGKCVQRKRGDGMRRNMRAHACHSVTNVRIVCARTWKSHPSLPRLPHIFLDQGRNFGYISSPTRHCRWQCQ